MCLCIYSGNFSAIPIFTKVAPFQLRGSRWWLYERNLHSSKPLDLGEKHSMGNSILLHLGVEPILECLHLVEEDDLRQIHLLTYHNLVYVEMIFAADIVPWTYPEKRLWNSQTKRGEGNWFLNQIKLKKHELKKKTFFSKDHITNFW